MMAHWLELDRRQKGESPKGRNATVTARFIRRPKFTRFVCGRPGETTPGGTIAKQASEIKDLKAEKRK
jgi:hypothetical protein